MDLSDRHKINIRSTHDSRLRRLVLQKINSKTKPLGALGFLEDLALKIGLIFKSSSPEIKKPTLLVFASDHAVVYHGRGQYDRKITSQLVLNFLNEGAAINVFAKNCGLEVKLIDVGVDHSFEGTMTYWLHHGTKVQSRKIGMGTKDFTEYPAMTTAETEKALTIGQRLVQKEAVGPSNTLAFGDLATGNLASGLAICCAVLQQSPEALLDLEGEDQIPAQQRAMLETVNKALRIHPLTHDPYTILALYGGYEIAAITGAILQAAKSRVLILIDGFISSVALLLASKIAPEVLEYSIICQQSGPAHSKVLKELKMQAVLNLNVQMGEGCGAALALPVIQNALSFINKMSSYDDINLPKPLG